MTKHVALQNLTIYYTWKNIRQQHKNNKLKVITPTCSDEFDLPDSSYYSVKYSIIYQVNHKKHETLHTNPPIHICINGINDRLMFKTKYITLNKSYTYLSNVEPSNLVFLKTYNTEFDEIIIKFTDQNGRPLEIEDKVNLASLINK